MIPSILILALALALYICYTFIVNDFFDMPVDKKAGKWRAVHELPTSFVIGLMVTQVAAGFSALLFLRNVALFSVFTVAWFMSTFYSAPPIRFKEKGILGALADMIVEKTLPIFVIFVFFNCFSYDALVFIALFSVIQLKLIIDHQIFDYDSDVASGARTLVVKIGREKADRILNLFIRPVFVVMFIILALVILVRIPFSLLVLAPIFLCYFIIRALTSKKVIRRVNIRSDSGWQVERIPLYDGYLSASISVILLFLAFLIVLNYPPYLFLFVMAVASQIYVIKGHYVRLVGYLAKALS